MSFLMGPEGLLLWKTKTSSYETKWPPYRKPGGPLLYEKVFFLQKARSSLGDQNVPFCMRIESPSLQENRGLLFYETRRFSSLGA